MLNPTHYQKWNKILGEYIDIQMEDNKYISPINGTKIVNLKFHESWEWLMIVVNKILEEVSLRFNFSTISVELYAENNSMLKSFSEPTLLLNTYSVCLQYMKYLKEYEASKTII